MKVLAPLYQGSVVHHALHGRCRVTLVHEESVADGRWSVRRMPTGIVTIAPYATDEHYDVPREELTVRPPSSYSSTDLERFKREHLRPDWERLLQQQVTRTNADLRAGYVRTTRKGAKGGPIVGDRVEVEGRFEGRPLKAMGVVIQTLLAKKVHVQLEEPIDDLWCVEAHASSVTVLEAVDA